MAATKNKTGQQSIKHQIINDVNTRMFISVAVAVFVVVFCIFASQALFSQSLYQQKIISEKQETLQVLRDNKDAVEELEQAYISFNEEETNVLGGDLNGDDSMDGDNGKIVLDALPSVLDYPGLSSSIEKILVDGDYEIESIGGGEVADVETGASEATGRSDPVEIPYPLRINAAPGQVLQLLETLELSIRPFHVNTLRIEGSGNNLQMTVDMKTYYQPASGLEVGSKVVQ